MPMEPCTRAAAHGGRCAGPHPRRCAAPPLPLRRARAAEAARGGRCAGPRPRRCAPPPLPLRQARGKEDSLSLVLGSWFLVLGFPFVLCSLFSVLQRTPPAASHQMCPRGRSPPPHEPLDGCSAP